MPIVTPTFKDPGGAQHFADTLTQMAAQKRGIKREQMTDERDNTIAADGIVAGVVQQVRPVVDVVGNRLGPF